MLGVGKMSKKIVFGPKKDFIWIDIKKDDENQFASAVINAISRKAEYKQQTEEISQYAKSKFSAENNLKEIINYFEGIISAGDN